MVRKLKSNENNIEFNKFLKKLRAVAATKECLWGEGCSEKIIRAHSIQQNGMLSKIATDGKIFKVSACIDEEAKFIPLFDEEGKNSFSTFTGFCGKHDKELFQPIEDKPFIGSDEQHFLFAFRSLCKEYHTKKEVTKMFIKMVEDNKKYPNIESVRKVLKNDEITLKDYLDKFDMFKKGIINKNYDELITLTFEIEYEVPIISNSTFFPYINFDDTQVFSNEIYNKIQTGELSPEVFLNVFPKNGKTIILISYLKKNEIYLERFLKQLKNEENMENKISYILVAYCENTAYSPEYIKENFRDDEIKEILSAYYRNVKYPLVPIGLKINIFRKWDKKV